MRLIKAGCQGFKRFADRCEMDVDEKLIAIVGPNEAGKSSFLQALSLLDSEDGFPVSARTRGSQTEPQVWARYVLEDSDRTALEAIPEAREVRQLIVTKASGHTWELVPDVTRDLAPRRAAKAALDRSLVNKWFLDRSDDDDVVTSTRAASDVLDSASDDLAAEDIARLRDTVAALRDREPPPAIARVADLIETAIANDVREHPWAAAIYVLRQLRPRFLPFEPEDRDLRSAYSFEEGSNAALRHLLALAGTSWDELTAASSDPGALEGVLERTRANLDNTFAAWHQARLIVRVGVADETVSVLVRMAQRTDYLGIEERSDGLRQFVALRAQVAARVSSRIPPVLLIDEADIHLHYNAQADLVQVLETQQEASKVIYTTHSAGCLPQDLGRGIRIITPVRSDHVVEDNETDESRIINWFWTDEIEGTGFSPLLIGMGASAFAFASTRRAVIAEGASDAILLPTMIREATDLPLTGYQVAPGLANVDAAAVRHLDLVAARVAYILDGDEAGDAKEQLLLEAGVPRERIARLGNRRSPLVLEDFIDADVYLQAVNDELRTWGVDAQVPRTALRATGRPAAIAEWCGRQTPTVTPPGKRAVAHRILDARAQPIVAANRREALRRVHHQLTALLDRATHE